ncbi:MAG TPA: ribonuclease D [Mariprofundaceae bacterium]|nr:ribonuclease D [Mariprofundaceae bacterium]
MTSSPPIFIATDKELTDACSDLRLAKVLCVDTEFHRESTYYPEFALIQVSGHDKCFLIDPLAIPDLAPLWALLHDPGILKVFHAGRQDMEIILKESGKLPLPVFDTQIAAALLGYGLQVGFGNLVQRLLGRNLPKAESFSDWLARPLTTEQLNYAADDVLYLMPIYQHLTEQLEAKGRLTWLDEEQAILCNPETYICNPEEMFWRVKGVNKLKPQHLAVLRELAAWRENQAQKRDIPRRRILSDEILATVARRTHLDSKGLEQMRGMNAGIARKFGKEILRAWQRGRESPKEDWPRFTGGSRNSAGTDLRMELLSTLVRLRADEESIAANILAGKQDLAELASWANHGSSLPKENPCLHGWRRHLIGDDILRMLNGEISLRLDPESNRPVIERQS